MESFYWNPTLQYAHYAPDLLRDVTCNQFTGIKIKQMLIAGESYYFNIRSKINLNEVYVNIVRDYPVFIGIRCSILDAFTLHHTQLWNISKPYIVITYITDIHTSETTTDWIVCRLNWLKDINVDGDASYRVRVVVCDFEITISGQLVLNILRNQETQFFSKEVFSQRHLYLLNIRAFLFVNCENNHMRKISFFYRNKRTAYFDHILRTDGIMKPYIKSMTGDPKCPINGRINGLFFMGRTNKYNTSELPPASPYGEMRLVIPAHRLFDSQKNLYFSDFFCHNKEHHISVVITVPGSYADIYCQSHLLPLMKYENEYLRLSPDGTIWTSHSAWVEVLYTEPLDLKLEFLYSGAYFTPTKVLGAGDVYRIGRPKRSDCCYCNL